MKTKQKIKGIRFFSGLRDGYENRRKKNRLSNHSVKNHKTKHIWKIGIDENRRKHIKKLQNKLNKQNVIFE